MRVLTFSRVFPKTHSKSGQPTYFVEKIWAGLADITDRIQGNVDMDWSEYYNGVPKWHTIRAGNRWKEGDWFSPRFWSGKPYNSKQALITDPIQIKKIWDFELRIEADGGGDIQLLYINNKEFLWYDGGYNDDTLKRLCRNDGLSEEDFIDWFLIHPKLKENGFVGQVLCWNDKIEY